VKSLGHRPLYLYSSAWPLLIGRSPTTAAIFALPPGSRPTLRTFPYAARRDGAPADVRPWDMGRGAWDTDKIAQASPKASKHTVIIVSIPWGGQLWSGNKKREKICLNFANQGSLYYYPGGNSSRAPPGNFGGCGSGSLASLTMQYNLHISPPSSQSICLTK
jgi:hypothetical protein